MSFKTMEEYNQERFDGLFLLRNDGDFADVIFLYRSLKDVLIADTHYIKSADYSGYVHCCGRGCPACGKNIRVQPKLFIPLYNISSGEIQFWDRSIRFENQLNGDVFDKFPNPSEYVFRITRKGVSGDVNTTYQITAVGRNTVMSYDEILTSANIMMPAYYERICKDYSAAELNSILNSSNSASSESSDMPMYQVKPRVSSTTSDTVLDAVSEIAIPESSYESDAFEDDDLSEEVNF